MINFPNAPTIGQQFTDGDQTWQWDGTVWYITAPNTAPGFVPTTGGTMTGTLDISGADLNVGGNAAVGGAMTVTGKLTLSTAPTLASDATTKSYVDTRVNTRQTQAQADARYLRLTGGTLTGQLNVAATIVASSHNTGVSIRHDSNNGMIDNLGSGALDLKVRGDLRWRIRGDGGLEGFGGIVDVTFTGNTGHIVMRNPNAGATDSAWLIYDNGGDVVINGSTVGGEYRFDGSSDLNPAALTSVITRGQGDALYVPTNGTNVNGYWVRYPDGTQICTRIMAITVDLSNFSTGTLYRNVSGYQWTFPAAFIAPPTISYAVPHYAIWATQDGALTTTTNGSGAFIWSPINGPNGTGSFLHMIAIGRWF